MQLPVDVKALVNEATNLDVARSTALSISVYIDPYAPADLTAHVRNAFASTLPSVRMTINYCDDAFVPHPGDDIAVIVAGASESIGAQAASVRAVGVPAMVVTTLPEIVNGLAEASGNGIPDGDLVYPVVEDATIADEPYALDNDSRAALDERMGRWIVAACHDKRLAYALAFPFVRRPLANDAVLSTSLQNAAIGLVPFIPGADLPVMTLNQAKMALQIAAAYDQAMGMERAKEILGVVGGAFACRTLARNLVEFIPVLGFIIKPGVAYGGTAAIGYALIEYFEGGENVSGVINAASQVASKGSELVSKLQDKVPALADGKALSKVAELLGVKLS